MNVSNPRSHVPKAQLIFKKEEFLHFKSNTKIMDCFVSFNIPKSKPRLKKPRLRSFPNVCWARVSSAFCTYTPFSLQKFAVLPGL